MTEAGLLPSASASEEAIRGLPQGDLLLGYQRKTHELLASTSLLAIEKSRRIGETWGLAADAVLSAAAERSAGGEDVFYISYSQEMTREFVDACGMWARAFNLASGAENELMFPDPAPDDPDRHIKAFRIDFASGFSIVALSSAPRSLRGMQGKVIIDEAAFVDNLAELLKAAMALLIWGGKVVVVSTHNGVDNPFNNLLDEIRSGRRRGRVQTVTFQDALEDGLYERVCLVKGITPTPEGKAEWEAEIRSFYGEDAAEELDCVPKSGAGGWLSAADIAACQSEEAGLPELYQGGLTFIGRDVARRRDLAIMYPFELTGDVLWLRERVEMEKASFRDQDDEFDRLMKNYRVSRALIDQTGMGEKVVEDAQMRHGEYRVKGVLFTANSKLEMATALKKRFEDRTIRLPDDPAVRADFKSVKKSKGTGDRILLNSDGETDGHADRFWAAALAALGAEVPYQPYDYHPIRPQQDKYDRPINTGRAGWRNQKGTF